MWSSARVLLVALSFWGAAASPTLSQEAPLLVDACEVERNPLAYNHKLVQVTSHVTLAFENFGLSPDCQNVGNKGGVWLELGGDAGPQTVYCCGDHTRPKNEDIQIDGYVLPLRKDVNLEQFLRLLSAKRDRAPDGAPCYDCTYFSVSATLMGRFFAGGWGIAKEDQAAFPAGYGHLGCCSLLVIQQVTDVTAERTPVVSGTHFSCKQHEWFRSSLDAEPVLLAGEAADLAVPWRKEDFSRVAMEAVQILGKKWNGQTPTTTPNIYEDVSRKYARAHGTWTSSDLLLKYDIELRKLGELQPDVEKQLREIWVAYKVRQELCAPLD
jgi:hypothetical protein